MLKINYALYFIQFEGTEEVEPFDQSDSSDLFMILPMTKILINKFNVILDSL